MELNLTQFVCVCACPPQVVNEIYPVWTYSYLALLFPVFMATDFLRYKPVLLLQAVSLLVTYSLLLKAQGLFTMQLLEFFFGLATASEVAYYSYVYSVVEPARYQRVTGYCRGVALFGSAASSLAGQLLLSVAKAQLWHLVAITLASAAVASVPPWFLPMPRRSLFFHSSVPTEGERPCSDNSENNVPLTDSYVSPVSQERVHQQTTVREKCLVQVSGVSEPPGGSGKGPLQVLRMLLLDFRQCYRCRPLLAWSLWWALATCGQFQVLNYAQALWETMRPSQEYDIYNGYVETLATLLGENNAPPLARRASLR